MKARAIGTSTAVCLSIFLAGSPVLADNDKWSLHLSGVYSALASDQAVLTEVLPPPAGLDTVTHQVQGGAGVGLAVQYRWTERIGFEIAVQSTFHDSEGTVSNDLGAFKATDKIDLYTFEYGANYYFTTKGRAEWSVGAYVPVLFSDDADLNYPTLNRKEVFRFDQDFGLGVKAAVDWPFAVESPWSLNVEARFMKLILESEEPGGDLTVDPAMLSIGFGYQF